MVDYTDLMGGAFFFFVILCITYTIKFVVDARTRNKLITSNPSVESLQGLLAHETRLRRRAVLRWGVLLSSLAAGFGVIELAGWREITPGAIGVLLGATGVGNLIFYTIDRKGDGRE